MQDTWVEDPGAFRKQPVGGGRGAPPVRSSVARRQAVAAGSAANGFSKNRHPPQDARAGCRLGSAIRNARSGVYCGDLLHAARAFVWCHEQL